jgi:hypothetical protein
MVNASPVLQWSFVALVLVVAATFVAGVYWSTRSIERDAARATRHAVLATVGVVVWLGGTFALAATGRLSFSSRPPTMMVFVVGLIALAIYLGTSRLGARLASGVPLIALVAVQGFRFPLELLLHRSYVEGLMPIQMSFSGFNWDIISGLGALAVAAVLVRKPRSLVLVRIWNTAGIVLLANIVTIAILSAPTPLRVFHNEPANVWIEKAPWVWLPSVFVLAAIAGHIVVYRRLRAEVREPAAPMIAARANRLRE